MRRKRLQHVAVNEVVRSQQQAEAELARLNALAAGKDVRYWWQVTRLRAEPSADNLSGRKDR